MRVLIAPDSFGDTLTAPAAASAMASGWARSRPGDQLIQAPQSDGGPGFVDVLAGRLGEVHTATVSGPLTAEVSARWLLADGVAYIESAQACGLHLLGRSPDPDTAVAAHSRGVGQLIGAALDAGATTVVVGLGGSGCTDGGRGMIAALAGGVEDEAAVRAARDRLRGDRLIAATDVEHPLLGPHGAAAVFGPQKGADPATVTVLEQRNATWATILDSVAGRAVTDEPGAGAAGGIGAALLAVGASRRAGAEVVAELTAQDHLLASADVVLTGEGRFDHQSLRGKLVVALAQAARRSGVPVLVLAGQVHLDPDDAELAALGVVEVHSVAEHAGSVTLAMSDAARQLGDLAETVARRWSSGR
ncbi:glycerate kinase [Rhodococcus spelaei]|uniref:Glycerate kinase n=1 Tax=Rhodococcus spelaei TaxID=2546320 RepID=A0A541BML5_9NOCA|nr:glycerate kinase [Rhodococcus spelaei]TQF73552.1 glycerate kinase [Rhodococcus spelaei]